MNDSHLRDATRKTHQGDEGEDISHPNAFFIPKTKKLVTHQEVKRHFPFKRETFYFRYRTEGRSKGDYVWIDVKDPNENVPMYYGRIFMKVLRLDNTKYDYDFAEKEEEIEYYVEEEEEERNGDRKMKNKIKPRLKRRGTTEDMMNFVSSPQEEDIVVESSSDEEEEEESGEDSESENELLNGKSGGGMVTLDDLQSAFDGMVNPNQGTSLPTYGNGPITEDVEEKIADVKRNIDAHDAQLDAVQDERSRNQAKLDMWSTETGGQVKNIRALLSTMHTVLYEGARWKEVGMSDLLTARDIQKQFLKAMRVVHTDKLPKHATPKDIAIAEIIYNALIKAKKTFDEKEGGRR